VLAAVTLLAAGACTSGPSQAELDAAKSQLQQKEAQVIAAQAQLTDAQSQLTALKTNAVSKADLDAAKSQLQQKEAQLTAAQAQLTAKAGELVVAAPTATATAVPKPTVVSAPAAAPTPTPSHQHEESSIDLPLAPIAPVNPTTLGWRGMAFVGGGEANKIWVIDANQHKLVTALDMGGPMVERTDPKRYPNLRDAHAMVFNKTFTEMYTVNSWDYKQAWAIKIDPKTFREIGRATAGEGGHHAALSPDDKYLYVANEYATTVSVIDTKTMTKIKDLEVGNGADYITPSMYWDGKAIDTPYLFVSSDKVNQVAVIDWRKNEVVKIIPVNGSLHGVNLTPNGKQVWVGVGGAKEMAIIDVASLSVIKTLPFPKGGPTHIVFSPDGKYAYATGGGLLQKIHTETYKTLWVTSGSGAHLGVSPDGKEVWTLNHTFAQGDAYPYVLGGLQLSSARVFDSETGMFNAEMIFERRPHEIQFVPYDAVGRPAPTPTPTPAAAAAAARSVALVAKEDVFVPDAVTAKPGEKLQFALDNKDSYLHLFQETGSKRDPLVLQASSTAKFDWTAPQTPGAYKFDCAIHPGMHVTVTVK
jgi:YVTN family beta-propeller protein